MNLQEFIDIRKDCPMCGTPLVTKFSARKQKSRLENGRYVSIMIMKGMRSCEPDYEVGYSFGIDDNSLMIEFYNEWDMSNHASMYMCKIFKEFHANMKASAHRFVRTCGFCFKYEMDSKPVELDLRNGNYASIEKDDETFVWSAKTEEGYKFILLDNYSDPNPRSEICSWRSEIDYRVEQPAPPRANITRDLPQIPFLSKEETGERLKKLLVFS
jgi:hypothetical protein